MRDDQVKDDNLKGASAGAVWDHYLELGNSKRLLYNLIAHFYRVFLIGPAFRYYMKRYFSSSSSLLHAGCGGGQVDAAVAGLFNITALDISPNALELYKKENGSNSRVCLGSIFNLPYQENTFDGIYNLGVMEHFSRSEIEKILAEFKRVLKPGGKILLFWPPEFGLSVLFFKFLRSLLKVILRREFKFHPDEISRLQSKEDGRRIIEKSGLKFKNYHFNWRDAFTYSVILCEK